MIWSLPVDVEIRRSSAPRLVTDRLNPGTGSGTGEVATGCNSGGGAVSVSA